MNGRQWMGLKGEALGVAIAVVLLAGVAQAKPWAEWAPSPLASDSSYAAFSALPEDSLDTDEFSWFTVQRDWRAQRSKEARDKVPQSGTTITEVVSTHRKRSTDKRFALLASRPYASLTDSERAWLLVENAAHNADAGSSTTGQIVGAVLIAGIAGAALAILAIGYVRVSVHREHPFRNIVNSHFGIVNT